MAPKFINIIIKSWIGHQHPSKGEWIYKWQPICIMGYYSTSNRMGFSF